MSSVFLGFGLLSAMLALCGTAYAVFAALVAARFMGRPEPAAAAPPVTLLKPLYRDEPNLRENLERLFIQDYSGAVQIVFGVHGADDPVVATVQALQAQYPGADTELVIDGRLHGANAKISNLVNMLPAARHEVLVLSDSDIAAGPRWLATVAGALDRPGVGAVTCVYTGNPAPCPGPAARLWSTLAAMGNSYDFLPNAIVGIALGLARPCFGSTIAIRRQTLEEIGGFRAFCGTLADDYEIGRAVRAAGLEVAIPAIGVAHTAHEPSAASLWRHELRWTRTIRTIDRIGHLGSLVTLTVPLAIIAAVLLDFSLPALLVLALSLAARLFLKARLDSIFGASAGPAWLLPLRDILSFAVFLGSLRGETVHWRGARFQVEADGAISPS